MSYGFMTKSFLSSPEHRGMQKTRKQVTAEWERAPRAAVEIPVACTCELLPYPHWVEWMSPERRDWHARAPWPKRAA